MQKEINILSERLGSLELHIKAHSNSGVDDIKDILAQLRRDISSNNVEEIRNTFNTLVKYIDDNFTAKTADEVTVHDYLKDMESSISKIEDLSMKKSKPITHRKFL